jgi:hypothetical protein
MLDFQTISGYPIAWSPYRIAGHLRKSIFFSYFLLFLKYKAGKPNLQDIAAGPPGEITPAVGEGSGRDRPGPF